jgi:hypothetical protein
VPRIADLKKKHGTIWCCRIGQHEILFRLLSWGEYKGYSASLATTTSLAERDTILDIIFQETVLTVELTHNHLFLPAGLVPTFVDVLFLLSGNSFYDLKDADKFNQDAGKARVVFETSPMDQVFTYICRAFPAYTPDILEGKSYQEILRLLAMGEAILGVPPLVIAEKERETGSSRMKREMSTLTAGDNPLPLAQTEDRDEGIKRRMEAIRGLDPREAQRQAEMVRRAREIKERDRP